MRRVDLTDFELDLAHCLAEWRTRMNRDAGVANQATRTDGRVPAKDPVLAELHGAIGELCYGKLTGRYPDFSTHLRSGGYDFVTRSTRETIDVKSTALPHGQLMVPTKLAAAPADYYVLMIVDERGGWYAGLARGIELFREEHLDKRYDAYCMKQAALKRGTSCPSNVSTPARSPA